MKYRVAWYGLLLSVVLNMVLAALLWHSGRQEASALTTNLYLMDGEGENWTVVNYKVVIDQERIKRGEARLRYIGSMAIDQSEYFGIEVIEDHETVYNTIHTSQGGPVSIYENLGNFGSITSPFGADDIKPERTSLENTIIQITWKDNQGEIHSERIPMSITDEIAI